MDPGTILAVVQTSDRILSLIVKYYSGVKNAKNDIEALRTEVEAFHNVLRKIQELVPSSDATKLPLLASLATAIKSSSSDIENIKNKLDSNKGERTMSRVGLRALQWPFSKKEVEDHIANLERHKTTFTLALNSDQTSLILGIDGNISQLQQDQNLAEQDRQLGKLLIADGAAFDSYYRQHEPHCVQNTRVDLLRQVQTWSTSQSNDKYIFWLNGMAGTGKSTIARTVACTFAEKRLLGASFFFSRGAGNLGNASKFVATLARQLADLSPFLKQHISQAVADHENVTRQGLRNQWKELILKPLSILTWPNSTLTLVIDALDECEREEDIKLILQLFVEFKDLVTVKLKIFLTSRPETPIRLGFRDMPEILHQDLILHDIPRSIVEHDICVFLKHELDKTRKVRNLPGDWPDDKTIDLLVTRSDCLFIYIATACRFISDPNWRPQERLSLILESDATSSQLTADLDGMYMKILKLSVIKISDEKDKSRLSKRFRHIIGSIVTLFDVLSTIALAGLLDVPVEEVSLTLDSLHSVLNVPREDKQPIRLLHPSFRDFLVTDGRCDDTRFYIDQELVHMELAKSCLEVLSQALKRDMCNLRIPGTLIHKVPCSQIDYYISKDVQYACRYWVDHLERVNPEKRIEIGLQDDGRIHDFLLKHFLHWLEALSLMGKIPEGVLMIARLEAMLEPDERSALKTTIYDAKRFILGNRSIIEEAPLQSYASALVFCPQQSVIKASNQNELPTWITRYPEVEDNWSASLQVLEGHRKRVTAVVFSSNGQILASACLDKTIRLWNPATGTLRSTLEGHTSWVTIVVFSNDGQLLASASWDLTIRLWDPATGTLRSTLEGHKSGVTIVVFSSDGQLLASASWDGTIRLWDPATGTLRSTLEGHTDLIASVAFSNNCQLLASASDDQTVRLWDTATGMLQKTLEGHTDVITTVAFSVDGQLLLSASADRTIRLWDPATGKLRRTLDGHKDKITTALFSHDGLFLASASDDRTIRLWDPATGTLRRTLDGHKNKITKAVFSHDCQLLASASDDQTIRLWDVATGTLRNTLIGHKSKITAVAFSSDGQLLASGSDDRTVRLWDPATITTLQSTLEGHTDMIKAVVLSGDGQLPAIRLEDPGIRTLRSTLKGHTTKVSTVVFSSDGQLLASGSDDQTIRLWDPATGTLRSTLIGHENVITAVAFSGDDQLLASASWDRTIRVWDPATGTLRSTLEGHKSKVSTVVFSSDGQLLASGSDDQKIRLWDPATGTLRSTLKGHTGRIKAVVFSGDSKRLASTSTDCTIRLWDLVTGTLRKTLGVHTEATTGVVFSSNGQLLASGSDDKTVRLWDPAIGALLSTLKGHKGFITALAFSGDDQLLASASTDHTIRLWDPETGNVVQQVEAEGVEELSFSPDRRQLETNLGLIQLSNDVNCTDGQFSQEGSWIVQGDWLTWHGHKALWFPPDFRPSCSAVRGNLIVMGHMSGRITFLELQSSFNP